MFERRQFGQKMAERDIAEIRHILGNDLPKRDVFEAHRPHVEWCLREPDGVHGMNHWARVMIWQEVLASLLEKDGASLDREALRWAAATHDLRRVDDGIDSGHGERSAEWLGANLRDVIPAPAIDTVIYLNRWHVPGDSHAPEMTPELRVFKDADGLDRVRIQGNNLVAGGVNIGDLNPNFLRHQQSRSLLVLPAQSLYELSFGKVWDGGKMYDCVLDAASELGIITK